MKLRPRRAAGTVGSKSSSTSLSLDSNQTGTRKAKALTKSLKPKKSSGTPSHDDNQIVTKKATAVAKALESNSSLTTDGENGNKEVGITTLAKAPESNSSATIDKNGNNHIGTAAVTALESNRSSTTDDNRDNNRIGTTAVTTLTKALESNSSSITNDRNGNNHIGTAAVTALESNRSSTTDDSRDNNRIGTTAVNTLTKALESNSSSITNDRNGNNHIGTAAATALESDLSSVTDDKCDNNRIGTKSATALAKALESNSSTTDNKYSKNDVDSLLHNLKKQVEENPYVYNAHLEYIAALKQEGRIEELRNARQNYHVLFPVNETMWLEEIEEDMCLAKNQEETRQITQLFDWALHDFYSINVWKRYIDFVTDKHMEAPSSFTLDEVRAVADRAKSATKFHIAQSHIVWDTILDFEEKLLEKLGPVSAQLETVRTLYIEYLAVPHSMIDTTWQRYSSFITKYFSAEYEARMLDGNAKYSESKKGLNQREVYEDRIDQSLRRSEDALSHFQAYIDFEKRNAHFGKKKKQSSADVKSEKRKQFHRTRFLYERAVAIYYTDQMLWDDYIVFLTDNNANTSETFSVTGRAIMNCPWAGDLWCRHIRMAEELGKSHVEVARIWDEAFARGMLNSVDTSMEQVVKVLIAKCDYERRRIYWTSDDVADQVARLIVTFEEGLKMVNDGDPYHRIDKYYIQILTHTMNDIGKAREIWENMVKVHREYSELWLEYAEWEKEQNNFEEARKIYKKAVNVNSDWPERIFDAYETFEHHFGSLKDLETALTLIRKRAKVVADKRSKDAQKAQANNSETTPVDVSMKRKVEHLDNDESAPAAKRSKGKEYAKVNRRDREHATVVIENLPKGIKEGELKSFFDICGKIREINIYKEDDDTISAHVEFFDRDSAAAALTKDKKNIGGHEITVYAADCVLYVTNFSEEIDRPALRSLFEKYGEIVEMRYPSQIFKKPRRFCYVEYKEPRAARAALVLDGYEATPGLRLKVVISNPDRRTERGQANQYEIVVRNLPAVVEKNELMEYFRGAGQIVDVRIPMTKDGLCKGKAFVKFSTVAEAQTAATLLNETEFKGCLITVDQLGKSQNTDSKKTEANRFVKKESKQASAAVNKSSTTITSFMPRVVNKRGQSGKGGRLVMKT